MAIYCVLTRADDNWGEPADRFKTRVEADERLRQLIAAGQQARLIRWEQGVPIEMEAVPRPDRPR